MIGKLITYGRDRAESLSRMNRALSELKVDGIRTNIPFQLKVMNHEKFRAGDVSTKFLDEMQLEKKK